MKPELLEYLKLKANHSFDIERNNCIQFTNKCWKIYHGHGWCDYYSSLSNLDQTGFSDPLEAADAVLQRTTDPKEGDLVALKVPNDGYLKGIITGFCINHFSVFLSEKGLRYLPTNKMTYAWTKKEYK